MSAAKKERQFPLLTTSEFQAITGGGVSGIIEGQKVWLGNRHLMEDQHIKMGKLAQRADEIAALSQTPIFVAIGKI